MHPPTATCSDFNRFILRCYINFHMFWQRYSQWKLQWCYLLFWLWMFSGTPNDMFMIFRDIFSVQWPSSSAVSISWQWTKWQLLHTSHSDGHGEQSPRSVWYEFVSTHVNAILYTFLCDHHHYLQISLALVESKYSLVLNENHWHTYCTVLVLSSGRKLRQVDSQTAVMDGV